MGAGAAVAVNLVLGLLDRAMAIGAQLRQAQAEGRDITEAELDAMSSADDDARNRLNAEIAKQRAQGR